MRPGSSRNTLQVRLADAADNRAVARTGGDPRRVRTISFAEAEPLAMAEKAETWRQGTASKSQRDWRSTMDAYVLPQLGKMHGGAVATSDVKRVLRPLADDLLEKRRPVMQAWSDFVWPLG